MLTTFLLIGLGAGVLSGLFGIGGGIVIVPALLYFAKLPAHMATGTSLGALLLPVGALGAWTYWRNGNLDIRASLWIALGLFVGAYFGARIAQALSPLWLKRLFAIFLVIVAGRMLFSTLGSGGTARRPAPADAPVSATVAAADASAPLATPDVGPGPEAPGATAPDARPDR